MRTTTRPPARVGSRSQLHLHRAHRERYNDHAVVDDILAHADAPEAATASAFTPTFSSSSYERIWILNYLGPFYDKGEIADVLRKVKGGKEANVYCCSGGPNATLDLIAAKVYRPRQFRNLRNDALYRQGREIMGPARRAGARSPRAARDPDGHAQGQGDATRLVAGA